ncbi:MAG: BON domain-containing protein [Nitrospira sp.]|nr:BON domain-containing protein [Nitrospira sp.]
MPMLVIRTVFVTGVLVLFAAPWIGSVTSLVRAESGPDGKPDAPPVQQRSKDPDVPPKEPDLKPKESEPKPKDSDTKPVDQKPKDSETKPKEPEPKTKEPETKAKEPESKAKEPAAKPKESEHKLKESEQKPKEQESKTKEKEPDTAAEHPCPPVALATEVKPTAEGQASPSEPGAGERSKTGDPDVKKPLRSLMVTAKLALMADPRLFPYTIEVDVKDKDLVLLGEVSREEDKRAAADIVRCLSGVHAVENRLKVEADATNRLVAERDKRLTQLVKERFEKSVTLQTVKFEVKTEQGIVTLSGTTRFQVIVLEAAQAARQVPGVRAVNTEAVRLVVQE